MYKIFNIKKKDNIYYKWTIYINDLYKLSRSSISTCMLKRSPHKISCLVCRKIKYPIENSRIPGVNQWCHMCQIELQTQRYNIKLKKIINNKTKYLHEIKYIYVINELIHALYKPGGKMYIDIINKYK